MNVPHHVISAIERIEEAGHVAYLVGGCTRDSIMGIPVNDWDIACSAPPDIVKEVFKEKRVIDIGIQHGTIAVMFDEGLIEVTTFRTEGEYLDHRRPETVGFVNTIEEDLLRRDFSMNAIAFNPKTGFIDPYQGRQDIEKKLIRCIGNPDVRLREDALRIMRAIRFAATLGFAIDAELSQGLHANRGLLAEIAPERVNVELMKMLVGKDILPVLMEYPDVLAVIIPEIEAAVGLDQRSKYHKYDVWEHTARAVAAGKQDSLIRLILLVHDLGKPERLFLDDEGNGHFYGHDICGEELAKNRLKELRFSNAIIDTVSTVVRYHQIRLKADNTLKWLRRLGEENLRLVMEVCRGDMAAHADEVIDEILSDLQSSEDKLNELIETEQCFKRGDLAIDGNDLKGIGIQEGRVIGRVLSYLLEAVIEGDLENTREALLKAAKNHTQME